ncbi:MAG TPA: HAMP domain-containing sensor histidine kinase [Alphaproteobacteria bacterium]|nr:HAMP domain-containing sensor histidine kinase [Alphaproteobacteria bacterium]
MSETPEPSESKSAAAEGRTDIIIPVLAEQARLLYQSSLAVPMNGVNALIVAAVLWHSFPASFLVPWTGANLAIAGLRLFLHRRYRRAPEVTRRRARWAWLYCGGAFVAGAMWGGLAAALPFFAAPRDYFFVALVSGGMAAGALVSLAAYLPAFLAYAGPVLLPLTFVFLAASDREFVAVGLLMVIYAAVILSSARHTNRAIRRVLQLQLSNAELNTSLQHAHMELDVLKQEKWTMLAHLSHELRTPLNAIIGFSEAMRSQIFGALGHPKYREYAGHMHSSGSHLLTLANEILDVTQGELGVLALSESDVDVATMVEGCAKLVGPQAESHGVRLTQATAPGTPRLRADETKLRQILLNLLSNAIKFTPAGGMISLSASLASSGGIAFAVADTGIGIAAADLSRVTMPFVRLSDPLVQDSVGAGLGLPICKKLAELHGAVFAITSASGRGTTCSVTFPASRTISLPSPPSSVTPAIPIAS